MRRPHSFSILSSVRKRFRDNFERPDTEGSLGLSDNGSRWDAVRGIFQILGERAFSPSNPSDYPIATVTMPYQDVEIGVSSLQNGAGVALWVSDAGNWWGLGLEQEEVECNCSTATDCNQWNQAGLCQAWNVGNCNRWNSSNCREEACASWNANVCTSFNASNCASTTFVFFCRTFACNQWTEIRPDRFTCTRWTCSSGGEREVCTSWNRRNCRTFSGSNCASNTCVRWNSRNCNQWNTRNCNQWSTETCNQWFEFTFDCQTCYPQWIRVIQSVNSTITTVGKFLITKTFRSQPSPFGSLTLFFQDLFINKEIKSLKVFTDNQDVEASLFYETNFTDRVDVEEDIVFTATGAQINPTYGILVVPSQDDQNRFVGPIDIDKN